MAKGHAERVESQMKLNTIMYQADVNDLKATFDELLGLLEERKQIVLADAQQKFDVNSVLCSIDIVIINGRINLYGTQLVPKWYDYESSKKKILMIDFDDGG